MSFTCSATYSKKIQLYKWEHNNLSLPTNDDPRYTLKNDGQTLEISQTKVEDRGVYRCVATRKGKDLGRSQNAALNVKGTCDIMLLSGNLGRSFSVPELQCTRSFVTFWDFKGLVFTCFCGGAAEWSVVQSIARVLKSFYNNGVSVSEEAIESQCKCNRLKLKCVTKNKSWFVAKIYWDICSLDIICSEKRPVFWERSSRKTMNYEEQIMSKFKYPIIFSTLMEAIMFIILQIFFTTRAVLKIGEYS